MARLREKVAGIVSSELPLESLLNQLADDQLEPHPLAALSAVGAPGGGEPIDQDQPTSTFGPFC